MALYAPTKRIKTYKKIKIVNAKYIPYYDLSTVIVLYLKKINEKNNVIKILEILLTKQTMTV